MSAVARRRIRAERLIGPAELELLADPQREFILQSLVERAKTAAELAAELGCPTTRLYHHLQRLARAGLVFVERTRRVSGIEQRHWRADARRLRLDRAVFGAARGAGDRRLEAILEHVFDQGRADIDAALDAGLIDLAKRAPEPRGLIAWRAVLRLDPETARAVAAEIAALYARLETLGRTDPGPEARFYGFTVSFHPSTLRAPPRRTRRRRT